jgi:hypothetical protein
MYTIFCAMLSCEGTGFAMGRSPLQVIPLKCLNGFLVSEVNSESGYAKGPCQ